MKLIFIWSSTTHINSMSHSAQCWLIQMKFFFDEIDIQTTLFEITGFVTRVCSTGNPSLPLLWIPNIYPDLFRQVDVTTLINCLTIRFFLGTQEDLTFSWLINTCFVICISFRKQFLQLIVDFSCFLLSYSYTSRP